VVQHYYTNDANFNVTALVDTSGDVVERYVYDPYGQVTVLDADWSEDADGASDFANAILYCGYYYDTETGLYHVRHRMYHPTLGRWLQRDPIERVDTPNLYVYCFNNPIALRDWSGQDPIPFAPSLTPELSDPRFSPTGVTVVGDDWWEVKWNCTLLSYFKGAPEAPFFSPRGFLRNFQGARVGAFTVRWVTTTERYYGSPRPHFRGAGTVYVDMPHFLDPLSHFFTIRISSSTSGPYSDCVSMKTMVYEDRHALLGLAMYASDMQSVASALAGSRKKRDLVGYAATLLGPSINKWLFDWEFTWVFTAKLCIECGNTSAGQRWRVVLVNSDVYIYGKSGTRWENLYPRFSRGLRFRPNGPGEINGPFFEENVGAHDVNVIADLRQVVRCQSTTRHRLAGLERRRFGNGLHARGRGNPSRLSRPLAYDGLSRDNLFHREVGGGTA